MKQERNSAHSFNLRTFVNKISYCLISTLLPGKSLFNTVLNGSSQCAVGCWYMRLPWLITERPKEQRGSANSRRASPLHWNLQHLWPWLLITHYALQPHKALHENLTQAWEKKKKSLFLESAMMPMTISLVLNNIRNGS